MCVLAALSCGISNAQTMRQVEKTSDNNRNYFHYSYNENNKVDSIYQEITADQYSAYTLFTYDENGNNVKQERYQMTSQMDDYMFTDYVNYTYDGDRIICRKNYNIDMWGGTNDFLLGGVYIYEYNMDNQLAKRSLYWDEDETRLYETIVYEYNNKGQLMSDVRSTEQFGMWMDDFREVYEYDTEGRLSKIIFYSLDYTTGNLAESSHRTFKYDEKGNLVEMLDILTDGAISEKHEYCHDTEIESSNTIFPVNIDDKEILYTASKNVVTEDIAHMRDVKSGELVYVDTERWIYEENDNLGLNAVNSNNDMNILSMNGNVLELGNVANGENVRIYDVSGKIVNSANYSDGINISNLSKGVYMVVTNGSCVKIRK